MTTRHSCLIGFLALALAATRAAWVNGAPQQPNVVVILSDDVGFSDLGCYGGEIPTPTSTPWPKTAFA